MRRGWTLVELMMTTSLLVGLVGTLLGGVILMGRQVKQATAHIEQIDTMDRLLETIRVELSSLVLNPFGDPSLHEGNSFVISRPGRSSIQFVTERVKDSFPERYLVAYDALPAPGPAGGIVLRKTVWEFNQLSGWNRGIAYPQGWPEKWVGNVVERSDARFARLGLQDIRWEYRSPDDPEGRVFLRVKLVIRLEGTERLVAASTMVGLYSPDPASTASDCPCAFASCFDPRNPDCSCCNKAGAP